MDAPTKQCFHCHGPLSAEPLTVQAGNDPVSVCSENCANTVLNIHSSGLGDFYIHRSEPEARRDTDAKLVTNWKTYERPAVMREFVRAGENDTQIADLLIQGVHCAACTWLIENTLNKMSGVSIEVNPVTTRAELIWKPAKIGLADLMQQIEQLGYLPTPFTERDSYQASERERRLALRRLLVAGLGMMQVSSYAVALYAGAFQGMDTEMQEFLRYISLLVATPIVLYSGAPFFSGAWRNLRTRQLGMDVPVALAIGAAWSASVWNTFAGSGEVFFDSATMFVFFLSGTRYLEAAGRRRALDLTNALAQYIPSTATRLTDNGSEEVGVMELQSDDLVQVVTGTAFPADGLIKQGSTTVDESMLTGESVPVHRSEGDAVVAGTINLTNTAVIKIEKTGPNTVLAQIGRLVTLAGNAKPELVQLTDRIASIFVSVVLLLAAATAIAWSLIDASRAFEIVLTVLVVTCPCALALATPAAFTVATSALARQGFLVRRAGALQALAGINHVVFDKTGTLTENELEISSVELLLNFNKAQVLKLAAALEAHSAHPIARAFRSNGAEQPATEIKQIPGGGIEGSVEGRTYRIGTAAFANELSGGDSLPAPTANRVVYLGGEQGLLAGFVLREEVRTGARQLIRTLHEQQIETSIASGDQAPAVDALATQLGAKRWHAAMLPADKLQLVQSLQQDGAAVAVIGDGINDAPVLAGANVSIAMGSGTSVAQHSADCVWLGTQLGGLSGALDIARRTMRIVKQNLAWALGYNTLAIPLAVSGSIEPWMAALGMSLSSLLVMLNALRLGRTPDSEVEATAEAAACCSTPEPAVAKTSSCCSNKAGTTS